MDRQIPPRSATLSSKADFDVLAKLPEDSLEGCEVIEAFSGSQVAGHDDHV